jgi:predicted Rossmann-fold nucleotide-binding protein
MIDNRAIIGVVGSHDKTWDDYSAPLGRMIAEYDYHLLTGAGAGVMSVVSEAFTKVEERGGLSLGTVPVADYKGGYVSRDQYPNPCIEVPILIPLDQKATQDVNPFSRNQVNVMTAHAIIALPGDHGTRNEVSLALKYNKPMILFGPEEAFKGFPEQVTIVEEIEAVREFLDGVKARHREEG